MAHSALGWNPTWTINTANWNDFESETFPTELTRTVMVWQYYLLLVLLNRFICIYFQNELSIPSVILPYMPNSASVGSCSRWWKRRQHQLNGDHQLWFPPPPSCGFPHSAWHASNITHLIVHKIQCTGQFCSCMLTR